jgi:hypothetical protein
VSACIGRAWLPAVEAGWLEAADGLPEAEGVDVG